MKPMKFTYKIASEDTEFEQIHALNYQTFVEEIPQHPPNAARQLIDRFHSENTYIIGLDGTQLAGMMAARSRRPFSLDFKVDALDSCLPACCRPCEIRLLSIAPAYRKTTLFYGLLDLLIAFCRLHEYDLVLISGTVRQLKLYRHLGFQPFGTLVGNQGAQYQPMYLAKEAFSALPPELIDGGRV